MACKRGIRESIEQSKAYYIRERELDETCPFRALWRDLVNRVHKTDDGFGKLSHDEQMYFAVGLLDGEVYNGGFTQYFHNSSGDYYVCAEAGLEALGASNSLRLLRLAKDAIFGSSPVPDSQARRWGEGQDDETEAILSELDDQFYKDPDNLGDKMEAFAKDRGLVENAA
jgi:hypothetical protein